MYSPLRLDNNDDPMKDDDTDYNDEDHAHDDVGNDNNDPYDGCC